MVYVGLRFDTGTHTIIRYITIYGKNFFRVKFNIGTTLTGINFFLHSDVQKYVFYKNDMNNINIPCTISHKSFRKHYGLGLETAKNL